MFNYRGSIVELGQNNTDVAIPFLVSSKGYAILWNTASFSYVDNRFPLDLNLESMAAPQIDYYILYGPQMDSIIHLYRSMTGHVPLFPEWAYGFFQSKDRYKTQAEILSIAAEYRARHIPIDAIVQDWFWWNPGHKGDPVYNSGYTDIPAELKTLHDEHIHAMISAWALMDPDSENFKQMVQKGFEIDDTQAYDPTNPAARDFFWNQFVGKLFAQGWDAFWLDSSEPEEAWPHVGDAILRDKQLHIGSGLEYTNVFPLDAYRRRRGALESRPTPRSASFCSRAPPSWASSASAPRFGRAMSTAVGGRCAARFPPALISRSPAIRTGPPTLAAIIR